MPTHSPSPAGTPCWIDLYSSDPDRAERFYGAIFGWAAEHTGPEFGGYVNFTKNGERIAGMMRNDGSSGSPDVWTVYLAVDDAKATTEAAIAARGTVYVEPMQVADLGTMGMIAGPDGAAVGLWQPGAHAGFGLDSEAGAPTWFELHTRDYAGSLDFYRSVFGWREIRTLSDTDEFRYSQLVVDGRESAGVMDASVYLPSGEPGVWRTYVGVDDVDAAVAKVEELGGSVREPATDTPYGRLAEIADPTGAVIKLSSV